MGGTGLVDDDQNVHVKLHDTVAEAPNFPANYMWISTREAMIRVVQKMDSLSDSSRLSEPNIMLWLGLSEGLVDSMSSAVESCPCNLPVGPT